MKKTILERKNWEIFIVLIGMQLLVLPTITVLSYLGGPGQESLFFQLAEFLGTMTLYFSYPVMVGLKLNKMLARQQKFNGTTTRFIVACLFIMTTSYIVDLSVDIAEPWHYVIPLTLIPCFVFVAAWPARPLKTIELRRNAGIWEYIPDAFQFIVWPLGVWWIQPRLNVVDVEEIQIAE
jgi:hypothetical protein